MRAAFVAGPKNIVSLPGEPAPAVDTVKPLELRYFWRDFTSGFDVPEVRDLVKVKVV